MTWVLRSIIVDAGQVETARHLCKTLAGSAGDGMLITGCSSNGQFPATHYISGGMIEQQFADLLPFNEQGGNVDAVMYLLGQAGDATTRVQVEAVIAAAQVTDKEPLTMLYASGLYICTEVMV